MAPVFIRKLLWLEFCLHLLRMKRSWMGSKCSRDAAQVARHSQQSFGPVPISCRPQTYRGRGWAISALTRVPCNSPGWFWERELMCWANFLPWWEQKTYFIFPFLNVSCSCFMNVRSSLTLLKWFIIFVILFLRFSPLSSIVFIYFKILIFVLFACFSFGFVLSWLRISSHIWQSLNASSSLRVMGSFLCPPGAYGWWVPMWADWAATQPFHVGVPLTINVTTCRYSHLQAHQLSKEESLNIMLAASSWGVEMCVGGSICQVHLSFQKSLPVFNSCCSPWYQALPGSAST